ncbi:hypothetical protein [Polaromonas aquatica]|uniref:hypothetical protein n=1 Tax=Polaromonas aquatica TaxID=332657 RepID=UPI003D66213F
MRAQPDLFLSPGGGMLPLLRIILLTSGALACAGAQAFVVNIAAGTRSLFLQVGAGAMTGGTFNSGGTPGNNSTINRVSVTIPAANLGAGTSAMTTDSTVTASPYDGFAFCTVPAQVYVGGFYRTPGAAANATLSATAPASLVNASGNTIPFNTISWVSGGASDPTATIPSGTFVGGTSQTLLSVTRNTWFESCLQFNYANAQLVGSGTFTGRVSYTLTAP